MQLSPASFPEMTGNLQKAKAPRPAARGLLEIAGQPRQTVEGEAGHGGDYSGIACPPPSRVWLGKARRLGGAHPLVPSISDKAASTSSGVAPCSLAGSSAASSARRRLRSLW